MELKLIKAPLCEHCNTVLKPYINRQYGVDTPIWGCMNCKQFIERSWKDEV